MTQRLNPTRSALPLALVGLAVALPLGVATRPAMAAPGEASLRISESSRYSWSAQLAEAAKRFYGSQQRVALTPTLPTRADVLTHLPITFRPADRAGHLDQTPRLLMLLDLPPPVDC